MPSQSNPPCSANFASSATIIARLRFADIRAYGTHRYRSVSFAFFARASAMRSAMKAVSAGG
jgi:hypothetical protein